MNRKLDRRTLLKLMGGTCFAAGMPMSLTPAYGADPDRFWVMVNAGGGWDPTLFIDPKGNTPRADGRGPVNNFSRNVIKRAGNITYVGGYAEDSEAPDPGSPGHLNTFSRNIIHACW